MSPIELQQFYEGLVRQLRDHGILCAITSGLACVHYGVAETTKDCDLLCHPGSFPELLHLLEASRHLPPSPLHDYGVEKLIHDARAALLESGLIPETALTWLPDVRPYFRWLD